MLIRDSEIIDTFKSCNHCVHFEKGDYKDKEGNIEEGIYCEAFPHGIPSDVYHNGHYEPRHDLEQENDVVFVPHVKRIEYWKKVLSVK